MPIITFTTDFGTGSRYVGAMKGVCLTINPDATLVDLTHSVPPQDVAAGALALAATTPWFPEGTIHVVVVDPGVGSDRPVIYAELGSQRYVLPDNGLLTSLASLHTPRKIVAIKNPAYWLPEVSATFHGRDIMAPVAARLSLGLEANLLGEVTADFVRLPTAKAVRVGQRIDGEVIEVDSFGNLITNITAEMLEGVPTGEGTVIACGGHTTYGVFKTYSEQPAMTLVALVGSTGKLELAIVDDNAAAMLGVAVGTPVQLQW